MKDTICPHVERCQMVAALLLEEKNCGHDTPHEEDLACRLGGCWLIGEDVECQPIRK